ncbi:MAG TPA: phospholipid carrier-dependent glycosyltransferase [Chthoniobacterales bacterium]|jgi:4-amino-4-deoxy-L-arabinose transferase-like glycosyltransferase|nr:phospholipid carrier-dependent glycosyltransferase [Chthoniobacterales bacterium]
MSDAGSKPSGKSVAWQGAVLLVALAGIGLRVVPWAGFQRLGFDEGLYRNYVAELIQVGVPNYPDIAEHFVAVQEKLPGAVLPPTRFLYIFSAYLWHGVSGAGPLVALHHVSTLFSILLLLVAGVFAWRLGGHVFGLAVLALMAFAPTQIHMAQHALIDGFFAFWATLSLWFLWENLRRPSDWRWEAAYTVVLALAVLTKENAAFMFFGLVVLLGVNRWTKFGRITPRLLLLTTAGPLLGLVMLIWLCGSVTTFVRIYQLLVGKASVLPYAIATGDGPWYRYLVDLLLVSPLILLLALGGLFRLRWANKPALYLLVFLAGTYLVMCNVRYGMNLRYTNMWDMPLRYLAATCLVTLTQSVGRFRGAILVGSVVFLCLFDLRQYYIFFVQHDLYELVTGGLLRALLILK